MNAEDQGNDSSLQFILEEYKSLRTEVQLRLGHRITLMTSNTATAGVLLSLALNALNSNTSSIRPSAELLLLVPLTTCLFGLLTAYHTTLIYDIGDFIKLIEARINTKYPLAMGWYTSSNKSHYVNIFWPWHFPMLLITLAPSLTAILLFLLVAPKWEMQTIFLLFLDSILILYFIIEYFQKIVHRRDTYRSNATIKWAEMLYNSELIPIETLEIAKENELKRKGILSNIGLLKPRLGRKYRS